MDKEATAVISGVVDVRDVPLSSLCEKDLCDTELASTLRRVVPDTPRISVAAFNSSI
ncbi:MULTISPECIES: FxSxx-COOH cyclophane-containing RiPP peptide [Nonomuraea]|uniref:FxSxx-COOH cyclophane-containing RiPP peptide n=1 Tax=Nonomuraea mangrovi TaxID=2316207 RepID=A0ABW4T9E5_9ACTN